MSGDIFVTTPTWILICYLFLINLVSFLVFGIDKLKAKKNWWRIPEKTLFLLAIVGGSIGALLGMNIFHHKTLHKTFRYGLPTILIVQILVFVGLNVWLAPH